MKIKVFLDRKLSSGSHGQLIVFGVFFLLTLLFFAACYYILDVGNGFVDSVAKTFADFFGGDQYTNYAYRDSSEHIHPWVKWTTLIACIVGSVVLQGLLIATLTNIIQGRADKVQQGDVRYKFHDHYLILGYSDSVPSIVDRMYDLGRDIVIVVSSNVQEYRNKLTDIVGNKTSVFVLRGDMNSEAELRSFYVDRARQVYIIGEEGHTDKDVKNIDCYCSIVDTIRANVDCYVHIKNQAFYDIVVHHGVQNILHFHPFNFEELWARKLLVDSNERFPKIDYQSHSNNIYARPNNYVHFVVMGFSPMGEALCREVSLLAHYPNFVTRGKKTIITCIDSNMSRLMPAFVGRHKTFFDYCDYSFTQYDACGGTLNNFSHKSILPDFLDLEFEFVEADLQNTSILQSLSHWSIDDSQLLTVAICSDDDSVNLQVACSLPSEVYSSAVPIFVYQKHEYNYPKQFSHSHLEHVYTFGYVNIDVTVDSKEIVLGKYVNYIYNQLYGKNPFVLGATMREDAEKQWRDLPIDKRWSNIYNASSVWYKLRGIGVEKVQQLKQMEQRLQENIDILSEVEHNRWNVEQLIHGYRPTTREEHDVITNDPAKAKEFKKRFVHDDIRPYSDLSEYSKDKDRQLLLYLSKAITAEEQG